MFKINSERELLRLLKVVSEEAVKKSKKTLNETVDTAQERYMTTLKASEQTYGVALSEQEEEPDAPDEEEAEATVEEEPKEAEEINPETLGVSFDSVIKDINTLRSGRSTKDKEIKEELLGYYDKLDEDERKILHLFLSETHQTRKIRVIRHLMLRLLLVKKVNKQRQPQLIKQLQQTHQMKVRIAVLQLKSMKDKACKRLERKLSV